MKDLLRILVVDDEHIFHTSLKNLFDWEQHGFLLVGFANNGKEALNIIDIVQPDIVITDIMMPEMNGVELIKQLSVRYPHISTLVISSFGDFRYVKGALKHGASDYILKTEMSASSMISALRAITNKQSTINQRKQLDKNTFLSNLVNNYYTNLNFISENLELFNINLDLSSPFFIIKGVWADWVEKQYISYPKLVTTLASTLLTAPEDNLFYNDDCIYILSNTLYQEELIEKLHSISQQYKAMIFSISEPLLSLGDFSKGLEQVKAARLDYFYKDHQQIFYYNEALTFSSKDPISLGDYDQYISSLNFQGLSDFITGVLDNHKSSKDIHPSSLKKNIEHLIYHLISVLENSNYDISEIEIKKLSYFKQIANAQTIGILKDTVLFILTEIESNIIYNDSSSQNKLIMNKIEEYISKHYADKILLSDVAEHVHLNYHYLSKTFRTLYGVGFNDYLNDYRINKAKNLLLSSNLTIFEIAMAVGFSDQSYFSKIFRESVGMSPRKFQSYHKEK